MTARCSACNGDGFIFTAPAGINPFNVRLPTLARILEKRPCWKCAQTSQPSPK